MNPTLNTVLMALIGGAIGAYVFVTLQGGPAGVDSASNLSSVQDRLDALERAVQGGEQRPAGLAARARERAATKPSLRAEATGDTLPLEAFEARVDAAVEKKIAAMKESGELGAGQVAEKRRKRVSLADAARDLELSANQEDGLRRIFDDTNRSYYKMLAAPDGDPEDVKRELEEAAKSPAGARSAMTKYMPKFLSNIGEIMAIEAKKAESINKLLGPEKAQRLETEFSVREDDVLGLEGNLTIGAEVPGEGR